MNDYIDRQAAIASAISGRIRTLPTSEDGENWIRTAEVRQSLLDVPPIEAEPVKHGRWIIRDNPETGWYRVTCSECGEDVTSTVPVIGFFPDAKVIWDYCPYCGTKMDAEEGEVHEQN